MTRKYYDLSTMETLKRKELFETDPNNYVYSTLHEIVDKSFDIVESYGDDLPSSFHEVLPFELLTQLLSFMSGIYDIENISNQLNSIEQMLRDAILLRNIQ